MGTNSGANPTNPTPSPAPTPSPRSVHSPLSILSIPNVQKPDKCRAPQKKKTAIDRSPHATQIPRCFPFSFPPPLDHFFFQSHHPLRPHSHTHKRTHTRTPKLSHTRATCGSQPCPA